MKIPAILYLVYINFFVKAKIIKDNSDLLLAYKLRGEIFGNILNWVPINKELGDTDKYDHRAVHLGIFLRKELVAYCRLLSSENDFMIENEFKQLISGHKLNKNNSLEISRLTLAEQYIKSYKGRIISFFIYKAVYQWSKNNKIKYWYAVVEEKYYLKLKKYFSCYKIGRTYFFDKNTPTVAIKFDLEKTENYVKKASRLMYFWFTKIKLI